MVEQNIDKNKKPGFRIQNYFVTFPEDEFIKEDEESGRLYILVDIYKIENNKTSAFKLQSEEITPEIEKMISDEVNRLLMEGMEDDKKKGLDNE
jgi:hypothetical protein